MGRKVKPATDGEVTARELEAAQRVVGKIKGDYLDVRILPDGSVAALLDLLYTRAIVLDCSELGYGRRFCFEDRALASRRFGELRSADDVPDGFVARR